MLRLSLNFNAGLFCGSAIREFQNRPSAGIRERIAEATASQLLCQVASHTQHRGFDRHCADRHFRDLFVGTYTNANEFNISCSWVYFD